MITLVYAAWLMLTVFAGPPGLWLSIPALILVPRASLSRLGLRGLVPMAPGDYEIAP